MEALLSVWGYLPEAIVTYLGDPMVWVMLLAGTALGYFVGVMPGLGPTMGMALSLSIIYTLPVTQGMALLIGIFVSAVGSGGITASGDPDSPAMASFRLESPYFSRSDHLTLFITGARWLDKGRERVYVDLEHGTAPWLPEGVTLTSAQRRAGGWLLTFRLESGLSSPFSMTFHDAEGNDWEMGCMGMTVTNEDGTELTLPLPGYTAGEVWLETQDSRTTTAQELVTIPIR